MRGRHDAGTRNRLAVRAGDHHHARRGEGAVHGRSRSASRSTTASAQPATVVGVIEHMLGSWADWDKLDTVVFHPSFSRRRFVRYLVRAEPGRRDALIAELEKARRVDNRPRSSQGAFSSSTSSGSYADDRAWRSARRRDRAARDHPALGIFGLASFNVHARVEQIGTRRAMGARRIDIVRYFLVENWILTTAGLAVGCVLAYVLGFWLSTLIVAEAQAELSDGRSARHVDARPGRPGAGAPCRFGIARRGDTHRVGFQPCRPAAHPRGT